MRNAPLRHPEGGPLQFPETVNVPPLRKGSLQMGGSEGSRDEDLPGGPCGPPRVSLPEGAREWQAEEGTQGSRGWGRGAADRDGLTPPPRRPRRAAPRGRKGQEPTRPRVPGEGVALPTLGRVASRILRE